MIAEGCREENIMPDLLIRGLSQKAVQDAKAQANSLGLSQNEYLRRELEATIAANQPRPRLTAADWARSAQLTEDLSNPEIMAGAWQ
jgi:uncharacterized protein YggE